MRFLILLLILLSAALRAAPVPVKIIPGGGILRGGKSYFVKGAGGTERMEELARRGGNSVRTWSTDGLAATLDAAQKNGLTVCAGIWLEPECAWFSYQKPEHCSRQMKRVTKVVREFRDHPALLFWGMGNESEADGKNIAYWKQIDALAQMAHQEDPAHPVFTAVAGLSPEKAAGLNAHAPHMDLVGINTYGALQSLREHLKAVKWTRPWVVTEYGPPGFWERQRTEWGAPLEQTSSEKASVIRAAYQKAIAPGAGCWGGYAFFWGQKQEATETWFGLFTAEGESTASVDVLQELWSGTAPDNRAPDIAELTSSAVKATLKPAAPFNATARVSDPDGDPLTWNWIVVPESAGRDEKGRDRAPDPDRAAVIKGDGPAAAFRAPDQPGAWRIALKVTDGKGHAATANFPFRLQR